MFGCKNKDLFDVYSRMQIALIKNTQYVPDIHPDVVRAAVTAAELVTGGMRSFKRSA